ncbi:hypothetical protein KBD08_03430 [Candidatus Babeliales bacterium]|nr:hypothetical protein [Candidatus Babeliales bacterium]
MKRFICAFLFLTTSNIQPTISNDETSTKINAVEITAQLAEHIAQIIIQRKVTPGMIKKEDIVSLIRTITEAISHVIQSIKHDKSSKQFEIHSQHDIDCMIESVSQKVLTTLEAYQA